MPPPLLLLLLLLLLGPLRAVAPGGLAGPEDPVQLDFSTEQPARKVSPAFLSFTIDASLATDPRFLTFLGSPKLRTLARGLSPAYLRFGGTKTDFLIFDPKKEPSFEERSYWQSQLNHDICKSGFIPSDVEKRLQLEWPSQEQLLLREQYFKRFKNSTYSRSSVDILYTFANCSGLDLIFGLNALLRTADLQWDSSNARLLLDYCSSRRYNISWELGNEPNSFQKKAGIFIDGLQLGEDFVKLHKLLGTSAFKNAKLYGPDIGQPRGKTVKMLSNFLEAGGEVIDSVTWHHYYLNGRTATKEDFLNPDVLDTFISPVQKIFQDYWLSLLFKQLVGTIVLKASVKGPARSKLRVYLHCTNVNHPRYKGGDLTLYALNLHNVTKQLQLPHYLFDKEVDRYLVKPSGPDGLFSQSVQLNDKTLKMVDDQTLPALTEKPLSPGSPLSLPAFSYGFFVIRNARVAACL
uniref:Heparanase n=1 Tax=Pipistrellus kuhlii TaxID=59472 RepID=A0A7J8B0I5_PIPKU|nr:heparanase [Pipistrellus kuhlii]